MDDLDRAALERASDRLGVRYEDLCDAELLLSYAASNGVDLPDRVMEAIFETRRVIQAAASTTGENPAPSRNASDTQGIGASPANYPDEEP